MIDSVAVQGNNRLADSTIIAMGGLNPGSNVTIFDIQQATKSMWASGQFEDILVRVELRPGAELVEDGKVILVWDVDEQDPR